MAELGLAGLRELYGLRTVIDELTVPHLRTAVTPTGEQVTGREDPLLVQLEAAVSSDIGRGSGGSSSVTPGGVIDAHALDVLTEIRRLTAVYAPTPSPRETLSGWVRRWYWDTQRWDASPTDALQLCGLALKWRAEILNIFEPVKRIPLRGLACPACGAVKVDTAEGASPAVVVTVLATPEAVCGACGQRWTGGELLDLRAGHLAP